MSEIVQRVARQLQAIKIDLGGVAANLSEAKAIEFARVAVAEIESLDRAKPLTDTHRPNDHQPGERR